MSERSRPRFCQEVDTPDAVVVELFGTNYYARHGCHICGGCTWKTGVLAEVRTGTHQGFRACEDCLKAAEAQGPPAIDARLRARADALDADAAELRALLGRLRLPSFTAYEAELDRQNAAYAQAHAREAPEPAGLDDVPGLDF